MDAESDDERAIQDSACEPDADADEEPEQRRGRAAHRSGAAKKERHAHAAQRVDRSDRQVDAAGDDHHRRADRHDREEARVGGGLDERI